MSDAITESQEWIDGLVSQYSPEANDIDVAIQNMGKRIAELQAENEAFRKDADRYRWLPDRQSSFMTPENMEKYNKGWNDCLSMIGQHRHDAAIDREKKDE
jgi:hypothetical protein